MEIESDFRHPPLRESVATLEAHFRTEVGLARRPLRNFHREQPLPEATRRNARPSAVLIPIVTYGDELRLLLTRRHHALSSGGHLCFPGGHCDPTDLTREATALRESHEEIGLGHDEVRIIGQLGDYVSHSGHHIAPIVGIVDAPLQLTLNPDEVDEIVEIPLDRVFSSDSYRLRRHTPDSAHAHYCLVHGEAWVVGVTVSILMGFYEELVEGRAGRVAPPRAAEPG